MDSCPRRVMHVDADAFFVSVEQALDPSLRGKAVIVGGLPGDARSVVSSASYEARAKGVHSAMPLPEALRLCPEAVCRRPNGSAYVDFSRRIMAILRSLCPVVQAVSLDDFYLDVTGLDRLHGPPVELARMIKRRVREEVGVPVTAGIGANRLVAKVASESAKPDGLRDVPPGEEAAFFAPLDVGDLPGVGPAARKALRRRGLNTLGQVAAADPRILERLFGAQGREMARRARGEDDSPVLAEREPARSISHEVTFDEDVRDREILDATLSRLGERVCARLREEGLCARTVSVKARYADFRTRSASVTLPAPTRHDHEVYRAALDRLDGLVRPGQALRLIGLRLSNLTPGAARQTDFLTEADRQKRDRLYDSLDALRGRQGFEAVVGGRSLLLRGRSKGENRGDHREEPPRRRRT